MTDLGDWLKEHWKAGNGTMPDDLAKLAAQLEEELAKRRNPGNPHLRESDHADGGGCPQDCLDFRAVLAACKELMEKYGND